MPPRDQLAASGNLGQLAPATDLLYTRAIRQNPDPVTASHPVTPDGYSTTRSFSFGDDTGETLAPQVVNGFLLTQPDAMRWAVRTGLNLGRFDTPEHADLAADRIHDLQVLHNQLMDTSRNLIVGEHQRKVRLAKPRSLNGGKR